MRRARTSALPPWRQRLLDRERAAAEQRANERVGRLFDFEADESLGAIMPAHAHVWIDPSEPAIARAPVMPFVGPGRHEMKPGREYVCRECGEVLIAPGA